MKPGVSDRMNWPYVVVALVSGVALACQVGFNTGLRSRMGSPIVAALVSFLIGTGCLIVLMFIQRPAWPDRASLVRAPWWIWMGGVVGAVYVASAAAFASKLSAAGWLSLIVTGQIVASLVLDHYGFIGYPRVPITPWRVFGAVLLLAGVVIVVRSKG